MVNIFINTYDNAKSFINGKLFLRHIWTGKRNVIYMHMS